MARVAKKAKRQKTEQESAAAALDELESLGDRLANWAGENAALLLGGAVVLLVVVGVGGLIQSSRHAAVETFAVELAAAHRDYRAAMGAAPEDIEVPEPANPETARKVRTEYLERFQKLAADAGQPEQAALAAVEVGTIQLALGQADDAIGTWRASAEALAAGHPMRGLLSARVGSQLEAQGKLEEAAAAYREAAAVPDYPLRNAALADAARCLAAAGNDSDALAVFAELEDADQPLAQHVEAQISELKARQAAQ